MREISLGYLITAIAVMIVVTYSLRAVSMVLFRKKLTGKFIFSFLTYTPYGVLAALIFPDIFLFTQTGSSFSVPQFICALCGAAVAVILSLLKRGLTAVSLGAVVAVFIAQQILC
ncbi:MAG: AzlD domain-containing protein [Ruminococcaceae bacterium]|nr:AzlD domain-containing protein [Oscillospiraceae bacterium]